MLGPEKRSKLCMLLFAFCTFCTNVNVKLLEFKSFLGVRKYCIYSIVSRIGVGASKFFGVQRIFAQITPNLPKKLLCNFADRIFGMASKNGLYLFFCKRWAPFCPDFRGFCLDIRVFCSDFQRFCPDFQNKSEL